MGWANFYGSLAHEYRYYGFGNGPLEDEAYKFEVDYMTQVPVPMAIFPMAIFRLALK